jgi:hypothetical protein
LVDIVYLFILNPLFCGRNNVGLRKKRNKHNLITQKPKQIQKKRHREGHRDREGER